jgi:hypothetical protein
MTQEVDMACEDIEARLHALRGRKRSLEQAMARVAGRERAALQQALAQLGGQIAVEEVNLIKSDRFAEYVA